MSEQVSRRVPSGRGWLKGLVETISPPGTQALTITLIALRGDGRCGDLARALRLDGLIALRFLAGHLSVPAEDRRYQFVFWPSRRYQCGAFHITNGWSFAACSSNSTPSPGPTGSGKTVPSSSIIFGNRSRA